MNDPLYAFLAGVFFVLSIVGWCIAHVLYCRSIRKDAQIAQLALSNQQALAHIQHNQSVMQEMQRTICELREDDDGEDWKNPGLN